MDVIAAGRSYIFWLSLSQGLFISLFGLTGVLIVFNPDTIFGEIIIVLSTVLLLHYAVSYYDIIQFSNHPTFSKLNYHVGATLIVGGILLIATSSDRT